MLLGDCKFTARHVCMWSGRGIHSTNYWWSEYSISSLIPCRKPLLSKPVSKSQKMLGKCEKGWSVPKWRFSFIWCWKWHRRSLVPFVPYWGSSEQGYSDLFGRSNIRRGTRSTRIVPVASGFIRNNWSLSKATWGVM